ncbi:MAG: type II secretion system GspH family protein [Thermoanaerobaculia bacterium]|nr:type II secretion system GspH family protein [Thermoanaerobaculia bacterium]
MRSQEPHHQPIVATRPTTGYQILELTVALALAGFVALLGTPTLMRASGRLRVDGAARELASVLHQARSYAVLHSTHVGLKFFLDGPQPTWAIFRDGDDDGVRSDDIVSGVDPAVTPVRPLQSFGARAGFGFRPGDPPPDPGHPSRVLDRLDDPIRFNNSDIASYSPLGTSTPGTLYLTDGRDWQLAVRVNGRNGRVRILTLGPSEEAWH